MVMNTTYIQPNKHNIPARDTINYLLHMRNCYYRDYHG